MVRLAFNRDELNTRPAALPPRVYPFGRHRAILPIDPAGGGTWIAVSDAGLALALLNVNSTQQMGPNIAQQSRGSIIPALLGCNSQATAAQAVLALDPAAYAPFRLVVVDHTGLVELRCDGRDLDLGPHTSLASPLLFTSSGLGDALVEGPRRRSFDRYFAHPYGLFARQDAYHRSSWSDRPEVSVCMRRDDARTVSHTVVTLRADRVSLAYHGDAPDVPAGLFPIDLPHVPGGAA
jgi:hypothetical protein